MPTIDDLIKNIQQTRYELEAQLPRIAEELANSTKVLAERNINDFGFGYEYSEKEVPAYYFLDKAINQAGRDGVKKKAKEGEGLSWGGFREMQGLESDHVTLNYSNEMWKGMLIVRSEVTGKKYISYLGHTNQAGQDKMNWNFERYGNFILDSLTVKDKDYLSGYALEAILSIFKKNL